MTSSTRAQYHPAFKNSASRPRKQLFPEWGHYGNNLSTLWDVLTTDVARPAGVVWIDAEASSKNLGAEQFGKFAHY